jgi:type I restriction-modification system DNA methylase subunit
MSIIVTDRDNFVQDLSVSKENKELYGEIFTPFSLIDRMLDLLPKEYYSDPERTWLDSGAGSGYITMWTIRGYYK